MPNYNIELLAAEVEQQMAATEPGHCARVDYLTREEAHQICDFLVVRPVAPTFQLHILSQLPDAQFAITADAAIELRNRKAQSLLLFVPTDLVDTKASSLTNSFAVLDGRRLNEQALAKLRLQLKDEDKKLLRLVFNQLNAPLRVSFSQRLNFACLVRQSALDGQRDRLGLELWRVGLIADGRAELDGEHLVKNRECVLKLAYPRKVVSTTAERLQSLLLTKNSQARLGEFFRSRTLYDVGSWSRELAERGDLTFDQWQFAEASDSDLTEVILRDFLKPDGSVEAYCKLHQPEKNGPLLALCDDKAFMTVKWATQPAKSNRLGRWRVQIVPHSEVLTADKGTQPSPLLDGLTDETENLEIELPSVELDSAKREARLRLNGLDLEAQPLDFSVCIKLTALDESGNVIMVGDQADAKSGKSTKLVAYSRDFYLVRQIAPTGEEETSPTTQSQRTVPNIAYGRVEAVLEARSPTVAALNETEPQWTRKDLDYFSLRLNERRVIHIGFSPLLLTLEREVLKNPASGGRYQLEGSEDHPLHSTDFKELPFDGQPAAFGSFLAARAALFKLLQADASRDVVEVADWRKAAMRDAADQYCRRYQSLLQTLAGQTDRASWQAALSVDSVLVKLGQGVEALVTLPTHPLRIAWLLTYQQRLREWEGRLSQLAGRERKKAFDRATLDWLTPTNFPTFAFSPIDGTPFVFFQNLRFFHAVALPASLPNPQYHFERLARWLGVTPEVRLGTLSPTNLASHLYRYRQSHPHLQTLLINLVNPPQGEFFVEAAKSLLTAEPDPAQSQKPFPFFHFTSFVAPGQARQLASLQQLRQFQLENSQGGSDAFLPALTSVVHNYDELTVANVPEANLTLISDLATPVIEAAAWPAPSPVACQNNDFLGLVARFVVNFQSQLDHFEWKYTQAPEEGSLTSGMQVAMLKIGGLLLGEQPDTQPALSVKLETNQQALLEELHRRSDWVITADRFFGLEYYDLPEQAGTSFKYVLDYAPEFVEGVGHRLLVTTAWRKELNTTLARTLTNLNFDEVEKSLGQLLRYLKAISGHLLFQTPHTSLDQSAAVGLGLVAAWLERQGYLKEALLIPVNLHPRLFSSQTTDQTSPGSELALVAFKDGQFVITFIKVQWRRGQGLLEELASQMVMQIQATRTIFEARFFSAERVDLPLQKIYLVNVLRFYLERSQRYQLLDPALKTAFSDQLTRLECGELDGCVSNMQGFIVSLDSEPRAPLTIDEAAIDFLTVRDFEYSSSVSEVADVEPTLIATIPPSQADLIASVPDRAEVEVENDEEVAKLRPGATDLSGQVAPPVAAATGSEDAAEREVAIVLGEASGKPVVWKPSVKGSPHLFIIGIPGQGKSWTTSRILIELAKQAVPSLVLDFHGQFAEVNGAMAQLTRPTVIDAAQGLPFSPFEYSGNTGLQGWKAASISIAEIFGYVAGLGDIQRDVLYQSILEAYQAQDAVRISDVSSSPTYPALMDILRRLEQKEKDGRGTNVIARCRPLLEMDLFHPQASGKNLLTSIKEGLVIDLHNLHAEVIQLAAGAFILRKIYADMLNWKPVDRLRLVIVLDEAHKLARDVTLPKIMKEGRKFGIAVVVASQGLSDFHADVLGNAGTKVVFRVNYPESRKVANYIRSTKGQDLAEGIEQLRVGTAYVQTLEMSYGALTKMLSLNLIG